MLDEVTRLLNMEKHLPSYKYMVSVSCLKVIRKLQKFGHLPSLPHIYHSYAEYGIFLDLRLAAMECLVDFVKVDGRSEDLEHLITLLETDPDPAARHGLAQLLIDNPPFTRESRSRLDKPNLVERLWLSINTLAYDTKLRCDIVDLYYALYGSTRPKCLQATESQSFYKDFIKEGSSAPSSTSFKKVSSENKPVEVTETPETPERHKPAMVTIKRTATEAFEVGDEIIKLERSEEITVMDEPIDVQAYDSETKINVQPNVEEAAVAGDAQPQITKRMKTEIFTEDDNSTMVLDVGETQTTRYESSHDEARLKADGSVKKKKKKDKKKHKHKHKHKHNKEKDKDKDRERERKDKDRRDPQISRLQAREAATPETLSSADSSNSNSNTPLGMN